MPMISGQRNAATWSNLAGKPSVFPPDGTAALIDGSRAMTGDLDMGAVHHIINLADPIADQQAATKKYVDSLVGGLKWQDKVLDKDLNAPPANPAGGDRYIIGPAPSGAWVGHAGQITTWSGGDWTFTALAESQATYVEDESLFYVYNTTSWVNLGQLVQTASDSVQGIVALATVAETNAGSDAVRAVTPDGLAGSNLGIRCLQLTCVDYTADVTAGNGKGYVHIPSALNGMRLVYATAAVITAGATGATTVDVYQLTDAVSMISGTAYAGIAGGATLATPATIDPEHALVATDDILRLDVKAVSSTAPKGLIVTLGFQLP